MGKTCNNCGDYKRRSEEWSLSSELIKANNRLFIVVLVLAVGWFLTLCGTLWYIEHTEYEKPQETVCVTTQESSNEILQ